MSDETFGIAAGELRQFIKQIEQGEAEKADAAERVKEIYAEAKGRGYQIKAMRKIVAARLSGIGSST